MTQKIIPAPMRNQTRKPKILKQDGFIAIIALGIFLMLSLFGIIVQRVTTETIDNVKTTIKYNEASDIADSVIEYLQYEMSMHEAGYSLEPVDCLYDGSNNPEECENVDQYLGFGGTEEDLEITMEIEGRNELDDMFAGSCPGIILATGGCYVTPIPGTGDAGERCDLYDPKAHNGVDAMIDHLGQTHPPGYSEGVPQLDYSCNWNKLSFGSSSTDRVTIPLYYEMEYPPDSGIYIIINPFNNDTATNFSNLYATELAVRFRAPCLPCGTGSEHRTCDSGDDETLCDSDPTLQERYWLDTADGNDIVVQWQISGLCDGEPCSYIQNVDYDGDEIDEIHSSVISEFRVNNSAGLPENISLYTFGTEAGGQGLSTSSYQEEYMNFFGSGFLTTMEKPILTLFLSEKLISEAGNNVPYLEYQVLTDKPIGSPKIKASTTINIDGYLFEKTLFKEEEKSIIDFAVQN